MSNDLEQLIWAVKNKDSLSPYEKEQIAFHLEKLLLDYKLRTEGVINQYREFK